MTNWAFMSYIYMLIESKGIQPLRSIWMDSYVSIGLDTINELLIKKCEFLKDRLSKHGRIQEDFEYKNMHQSNVIFFKGYKFGRW